MSAGHAQWARVRYGDRIMQVKRGPVWLHGQFALIAAHSVATAIRRDLHARYGDYTPRFPIAADQYFIIRACAGGAAHAARPEVPRDESPPAASRPSGPGTADEIPVCGPGKARGVVAIARRHAAEAGGAAGVGGEQGLEEAADHLLGAAGAGDLGVELLGGLVGFRVAALLDRLASLLDLLGDRWATSQGQRLDEVRVRSDLHHLQFTLVGLDLIRSSNGTWDAGPSARWRLPRATALAHLWSKP